MKHFILALLLTLGACSQSQATLRTVNFTDTLNNVRVVVEVNDTIMNGVKQTDTLSITTYNLNQQAAGRRIQAELEFDSNDVNKSTVAIIGIVAVFGLPAIIILSFFYFRYKNRKAMYRLAEQAIASGQPLPQNFFNEAQKSANGDLRTKGINSICVGIGLFVLLWALTGEFGLGCIGLLIMFMGFGKLISYYLSEQNRTDEGKRSQPTKSEEENA